MSAEIKIREHLQRAASRAVEQAIASVQAASCESEIERVLMAAFKAEQISPSAWPQLAVGTYGLGIDDALSSADEFLKKGHPFIDCIISPQVCCADYRADFVCFGLDINQTINALAIECDGHEFHEKTKEQARRDKSRDRTFIVRDIPVMRFTGSEIWRDAQGCVSQVQQYFRHLAFLRKAV